jgi:hypothetical protein
MKLILKQPLNKLPFIGIEFKSEYEAECTNKMGIESYYTHTYHIILEPIGTNINVIMHTADSNLINLVYKNVEYDPIHLQKFLAVTSLNKNYNFSHVVLENNKHKVVQSQTNRRLWVLKVNTIKLLFEY